jgi:cell division protein FtsA
MSGLPFGITPKMKPVAQKRSAVVAALDIGTSKIACLIGRLKPREPDEVLRYRSHSVDIIGFGHTLARGIKAGTVVDLEQAEAAVRQCADLAERAARVQLDAVIIAISSGRPASELMCASIDLP